MSAQNTFPNKAPILMGFCSWKSWQSGMCTKTNKQDEFWLKEYQKAEASNELKFTHTHNTHTHTHTQSQKHQKWLLLFKVKFRASWKTKMTEATV